MGVLGTVARDDPEDLSVEVAILVSRRRLSPRE